MKKIHMNRKENNKSSFMPLGFNLLGFTTVLIVFITLFIMFSTHSFAQIQTDVPALKDVYANDFYIGCILSYKVIGFIDDPPVPGQSTVVDTSGGRLIKFHMNSMSPGNNLKAVYTVDIDASAAAYAAATTNEVRDSIDAHSVVRFNGNLIAQLNWAKRQGFTFHGHTLVYYDQAPIGFFRSGYTTSGVRLTKDKMILRMDNYIHEIIRLIHEGWPGLLSAIDVVNEAIDYTTGVVRTSGDEWFDTFSDSTYVMTAFQLARKYTVQYGETQIKLYYNDCPTEDQRMADGIVRLCTPIFQAGYLDGIGMQEHNFPDTHPTAQGFITEYNKFSPICTEISITELDMAIGTRTPTESQLATQANQFGMLFKCFVERSYRSGRGKIVNVTKDGLSDNYTFQTNTASSLWDTLNQCKPAFYTVVHVGINYDSLDLLISKANALHESEYTTASWANLISVLTSSKNAMAQNYSATESADTALGKAKDNLKAAIDGLVNIVDVDKYANVDNIKAYALNQNYPNPFNPSTTIRYKLPMSSFVTLKIMDLLGREVTTLINERKNAGVYEVKLNASKLTSGVYFYCLLAGSYGETKKLILIK
jgi:GH35 family endo-1,4-beta-xylanase